MHIFTLFILYIFTNCERKTSVDQSTNIKQKVKQPFQIFSNTDGEKSKVGDGEKPKVGDGEKSKTGEWRKI